MGTVIRMRKGQLNQNLLARCDDRSDLKYRKYYKINVK